MSEPTHNQPYFDKDPQEMTAGEARLAVAHWRAKYYEVRQSQVNMQTDLDAVLDLMHEERMRREATREQGD